MVSKHIPAREIFFRNNFSCLYSIICLKNKSNNPLNIFIMANKSVMLVNVKKYLQNLKVTKTEENLALNNFLLCKYLTLANKLKLIVRSKLILHESVSI